MNPCNDQGGEEKKFWGYPEFMEQFLLYMDPATILSVASSHISSCCIVQILEDSDNPSIWKQLWTLPLMTYQYISWVHPNCQSFDELCYILQMGCILSFSYMCISSTAPKLQSCGRNAQYFEYVDILGQD